MKTAVNQDLAKSQDSVGQLSSGGGWLNDPTRLVSVSLFNGISTFVGYLMPKPFSKKNSSGTI